MKEKWIFIRKFKNRNRNLIRLQSKRKICLNSSKKKVIV